MTSSHTQGNTVPIGLATIRQTASSRHRLRQRVLGSMSPTIALAVLTIAIIALIAVLAPLITPFGIDEQSLLDRLAAPGTPTADGARIHLLGTDQLGRDLWTRVAYGARVSLGIGIIGTSISFLLGASLGMISGIAGRPLDSLIMFGIDTQQALPFIVVALTGIAIFGTRLIVLIVVVGVSGWDTFARFARGMTLSVRSREYILAARVMGQSTPRTMLYHVLPNILAPLIVLASLHITAVIMLESSLSFLGLGVQPPTPSWGSMIGDGRQYLNTGAWWLALVPGGAIIMTTISLNFIGDWMRDVLDPT